MERSITKTEDGFWLYKKDIRNVYISDYQEGVLVLKFIKHPFDMACVSDSDYEGVYKIKHNAIKSIKKYWQ